MVKCFWFLHEGKVLKETRYRAFGTKQETEPIPINAKLFRCYVAEDMEEAEPIRFLVPDMVMEGGVGLIWGKSGSGKTAFLLDLVLSVATGGDFAGRATQQCNVLYAALEGATPAASTTPGRWNPTNWPEQRAGRSTRCPPLHAPHRRRVSVSRVARKLAPCLVLQDIPPAPDTPSPPLKKAIENQ